VPSSAHGSRTTEPEEAAAALIRCARPKRRSAELQRLNMRAMNVDAESARTNPSRKQCNTAYTIEHILPQSAELNEAVALDRMARKKAKLNASCPVKTA